MNFIRNKTSVFLSISICVFLISCGKKSLPFKIGKTLRYRIQSNPPTLDPAHSVDTTSNVIIRQVFEGLLKLNPRTLKVEPAIAKRYEVSDDGLTYTFYLKRNIFFHNGRKCIAQDVKYSFERILNPATRSERTWVLDELLGADTFMKNPTRSGVKGITVVDTFTITLRLSRPFAPFLSMLGMVNASVVPREEIEKGEDVFLHHPVGTGPFQYEEWQQGVKVVLKKNTHYHETPPELERIVFRVIQDIGLAWEAYRKGEIDILNDLPPGQIQKIRETNPDEYHSWSIIGTNYIGINMTNPVLGKNRFLRQALNYSLNKKELIQLIEEGEGAPPRGVLPPGMMGVSSLKTIYKYDPEKAKKLMMKAGYSGGKGLPEFTLWFNTRRKYTRLCQYLQAEWKKIGVRVRLKNLDWPSYIQACENGEPELFRMGWMADIPDPDNFLYVLLHSSQAGPPGNFTRYHDPAFDELVQQARLVTAPKIRTGLYAEAEQLVVADAPWVFLYHYREILMVKPSIHGLVLPIQGPSSLPMERLSKE